MPPSAAPSACVKGTARSSVGSGGAELIYDSVDNYVTSVLHV